MFSASEFNQLYRYCYTLLRDEDQAYDLLQDSLEKFLKRGIATHTEINSNKHYIRQIIRNGYIDGVRKSHYRNHESYQDEHSQLDIDTRSLENIVIDTCLVDQIMATLHPIERETLYLWAIEGYSASEISRFMAIPRGTVLSRIHRIRKKIQNDIDGQTYQQPAGEISA